QPDSDEVFDRKIIEQSDAKQEREQVEKTIVAGQENEQLQNHECEAAQMAQPAWKENQEGDHQLDEEHHRGTGLLKPVRQLVGIPADPGGQRLGLVVVEQRGKVVAGRLGGERFNGCGCEQQQEQRAAQETRGQRCGGGSGG